MSVRLGLLAVLAEGDAHGYQLKTDFERRTAGSWALNIGQVYTTLQRLERDGLVQSLPSLDDRHEYHLTAAGRTELDRWFVEPVASGAPAREELTIKVLLAVASADVDVSELLQRQRRASVEQLQAYTRRKAQVDPEQDAIFLILLDALIFRTEAEVRWLDASEARLKQLSRTGARTTR